MSESIKVEPCPIAELFNFSVQTAIFDETQSCYLVHISRQSDYVSIQDFEFSNNVTSVEFFVVNHLKFSCNFVESKLYNMPLIESSELMWMVKLFVNNATCPKAKLTLKQNFILSTEESKT